MNPFNQPLKGIRILDFSRLIAGPMATMILSDLGAEVIKLEPPVGDEARRYGKSLAGGNSGLFLSYNRNKRSTILDLRKPKGRELALRLASRCDVLIEKVGEELTTYVRPQTFPVAVKMLKDGEEIPPKTRQPQRDLGIKVATCQSIALARRYGWTLAVSKEDLSCAPGLLAIGFAKPNDFYAEGNIAKDMYCGTLEAGAAMEAAIPKFQPGLYKTIVLGPIDKVSFEPDLILMYGNSAQVMRLVQGALFKQGGTVKSEAQGRLDCADIVVRTMQTNECQYVLPCTGDRQFALTADDELCFTMPASKVEDVLEGLRESHKFGIRYPVPMNLQWTAKFPPKYNQLYQMLMEQQ